MASITSYTRAAICLRTARALRSNHKPLHYSAHSAASASSAASGVHSLRFFSSKRPGHKSRLLPPDLLEDDIKEAALVDEIVREEKLPEAYSSLGLGHEETTVSQRKWEQFIEGMTEEGAKMPPFTATSLIPPDGLPDDDLVNRMVDAHFGTMEEAAEGLTSYYDLPQFDHLSQEQKDKLWAADFSRYEKMLSKGLVFDPVETEDPEADGWTPEVDEFGEGRYPRKGPVQSPPWVDPEGGEWFDIDHDDGRGVTERVRAEDLKTGKRLNEAGTRFIYQDEPPGPSEVNYRPKLLNRKEARAIDTSEIRYTNLGFLSKFVSPNGAILGRRHTGVSAKDQRKIAKAIKRARATGLVPHVGGWKVDVAGLSFLGEQSGKE